MKTILIFFLLISSLKSNAQYSGYYTLDVNQNVTNKITGNVTINKNISTIDYGELALANAQNEKNRLENLKYSDARKREISLEIASNPMKSFDYGYRNSFEVKRKDAKAFGFKKFTMSYHVPHRSMFVSTGEGRYENVSYDGIITEIIFMAPVYNKDKADIDAEKNAKMENVKVGTLNEKMGLNGEDIYVHKIDTNRGTVFGFKGFIGTLIWEDDYQYTITDNYIAFDKSQGDGVYYTLKVRYYGDKDEISFEQLEGRNYLKRLLNKLAATAMIMDMKF